MAFNQVHLTIHQLQAEFQAAQGAIATETHALLTDIETKERDISNKKRSIALRKFFKTTKTIEYRISEQSNFLYEHFEDAFLTHANATRSFHQADIVSYATATARWGRVNSRFGGSNTNMRNQAVDNYRDRVIRFWGRLLNANNLATIQQM